MQTNKGRSKYNYNRIIGILYQYLRRTMRAFLQGLETDLCLSSFILTTNMKGLKLMESQNQKFMFVADAEQNWEMLKTAISFHEGNNFKNSIWVC